MDRNYDIIIFILKTFILRMLVEASFAYIIKIVIMSAKTTFKGIRNNILKMQFLSLFPDMRRVANF